MIESKKIISYKHLERLFTSQEYFVWNNDVEKEIFIIQENEENDVEPSVSENKIWEILLDTNLDELKDYKFIEIIKNGFDVVNSLFIDQVIKEAGKNKYVVINERSNELAFAKTMEAIKNPKIDWIINPIFIYEDMIIKPSIYKKQLKEVCSLLYGSKTSIKNYIRAYFEYCVLRKLNIEVLEYYFYTFSNKKYIKEKDLAFTSQNICWIRTTPSFYNDIKEKVKETIIEKLVSGIIRIDDKKTLRKNVYLNEDYFDTYIKQIRDSKMIREPSSLSYKDKTCWGTNPYFNELFSYKELGIPKVCGYLLDKNDIINLYYGDKNIDFYKNKKNSFKYVMECKNHFDVKIINKSINELKNKKIVWYDFEGFSMPYTIVPYSKPYQQIVFQVSIIRTINDKEELKRNIIIDPLKITYNDFISILNNIYWEEADYYVVYNKTYELTRIKEMWEMISSQISNSDELNNLANIANTIDNKTFDLFDLFKTTSSKQYLPPIFLHDLLGFSSIKKLEKYITDHNLNLPVMIKPYKDLEVQNGLMAMNKAIQRYLGSIGDKEWKKIEENLKEYCENDVRAMIMVYYFILYIKENDFQLI